MLNRLIKSKVSSKNLAFFRMLYGIVLLLEVLKLKDFQNLIYDKVPFFELGEISLAYVFNIWILVIGCIIVGFKTRVSTIINYIIGLILIGTIKEYEYHMFYTYMGVNFLLIFTPVSASFSIDNLLERINNSSIRKIHKPEEKVSEFYYVLLIFFGVAIVYFDSIFYKLSSPMWKAGLGMWKPASMPFAVYNNLSWLLNQEMIMKFLGYLTIVFELVFIFFYWNRWMKWPLLIVGVGLHIGIWIIFPIPQFAQGVIAIYALMLPLNFFDRFKTKESKNPLLFFYDSECPLCLRTRIIIEFFDVFKQVKFLSVQGNYDKHEVLKKYEYDELLDNIYSINNGKVYSGVDTYIQVLMKMKYTFLFGLILKIPGIYHLAKKVYSYVAKNRNTERCNEDNCEVGFGEGSVSADKVKLFKNFTTEDLKGQFLKFVFFMFLILQIITSLRSPLIYQTFVQFKAFKVVLNATESVKSYSKSLFGVTNHGVFMDNHFKQYNHIFRVDYVDGNKQITLPIINKNGMPDAYLKNFNWVKWTFRVDCRIVDMEKLNKGVKDFSVYWLNTSKDIKYEDSKTYRFKIYCKIIDSPNGYEYDFLNRQIAKPWIEVGTAEWSNRKFTSNIPKIEDI